MDIGEITVRVEWGREVFEFRGDPKTVTQEFEKLLLKILPQISLARKLFVSLDAQDLAEILKPLVKITPENNIILTESVEEASLSDRVLVTLIAQRFLCLSGLSENEYMGLSEIGSQVLASHKSISSRLSELNAKGFIEKTRVGGQVKYKITVQGILNFKAKKLFKILKTS